MINIKPPRLKDSTIAFCPNQLPKQFFRLFDNYSLPQKIWSYIQDIYIRN